MLVDGLPEVVKVGECFITQTTEAQVTRQVDIVPQSGFGLVFRKRATYIEVGPDLPKTVCLVPFRSTVNLNLDLERYREKALNAVGALAATLESMLAAP